MNKISTLFVSACLCVFANSASAQFSQSFDSETEVAALPSQCWSFVDFAYSTNGLKGSSGSLETQMSDSAVINTPLFSKPEKGPVTITLTYQITAEKTGINALKVNLVDAATGAVSNVKKINASISDGVATVSYSQPANKVPTTFTIQVVTLNVAARIDDLSTDAALVPNACTTPIQTPMPVKLMSFAGSINNNKSQLRWSVADNETGDEFVVLRSGDGRNFTQAGIVFISGKAGAESYTFTDPRELDAVTYYKLKIVNKDGSTSYSNVIILKNTTDAGSKLTILQNPVASTLNFSYTSASTTQSNINIYSTTGVKVYSSRMGSHKGLNTVSLNVDRHLAAGTYVLEVVNGVERTVTRLVKK